jgi:hypothetical protein
VLAVPAPIGIGDCATPLLFEVLRHGAAQYGGAPIAFDLLIAIKACEEALIESDLYGFHVGSLCWFGANINNPSSFNRPSPEDWNCSVTLSIADCIFSGRTAGRHAATR